ncbi:hypothetical protein F5Y03DRAFT_348562 [Xylaria venustula]|nr:hypothetical protein F5Y03DRAFT_348562 [Xylaria venustula]
MIDLPAPPSLRHHASNPSIGRRWGTGSSTSLSLAPPNFNPTARPSTSDGKSRAWANPLKVDSAQNQINVGLKGPLSPALTVRDDGPTTPSSAAPKSPLGRYELKLDLPENVSSFADFGNFGEAVEAPAPLRIKKQASTRLLAKPQVESQSLQKPPSPPQSIDDRDILVSPLPNPTQLSEDEMRPLGAQSHRSIPSGFSELQNVISNFGPSSLPSPSTTPRASEEKPPTTTISPRPPSLAPKRGNAKPIIQNVRAKRDTLTINPQRRRSLQMRIEAAEKGNIPPLSLVDRPKTSNSRRFLERPPPLTLNTGFRLSDGPQSAPFPLNPPRSFTPTNLKSPLRVEFEVQKKIDRPSSGIDSPTGSSIYEEDGDDDVYEHPPSPESTSPVMPLTGPLASPCFPPSSQSVYSYSSISTYPRKDDIESERSLSPPTPPVPPRSSRRHLPAADSSYWPSPSPIVPSLDRAAMSPSPAESRWRSESESSAYEPLEPPRIPNVRSGAESPTFRSFSRPWTPTTRGEFTANPLKRAETAGRLLDTGTAIGSEVGAGLRPPPRSATVKTARIGASTLKSAAPIGAEVEKDGFI